VVGVCHRVGSCWLVKFSGKAGPYNSVSQTCKEDTLAFQTFACKLGAETTCSPSVQISLQSGHLRQPLLVLPLCAHGYPGWDEAKQSCCSGAPFITVLHQTRCFG
jgi:hypothetical protein